MKGSDKQLPKIHIFLQNMYRHPEDVPKNSDSSENDNPILFENLRKDIKEALANMLYNEVYSQKVFFNE